MNQPKRILFPVDLSRACRAAAASVNAWASRFEAEVTLLYSSSEADATRQLSQFAEESFPKLAVHEAIVTEAPGPAILQRRPDLIMMPTRGWTTFRARMLGSVTTSVLEKAECPVWTTAHAETGHSGECRRIVCAVDLSDHSVDSLRWLALLKQQFGAECRVIHCVPEADSKFESGLSDRAHSFLLSEARRKYPAVATAAGVDEPLEILTTPGVAASIGAEVDRFGADLLIVGRGAIGGMLGRLRSNVQEIIRTSKAPVLSV